jgi:DNA-binding response OmpR family regulator
VTVNRPSILVVDGDPESARGIEEALAGCGFEIRIVASGEEALAAVRGRRPDAVVLEVVLPGISGFEVCHVIRAQLGYEPPIMLVSARKTDVLDRVAGLNLGADDYLVKPFAPDELIARVRALTRRQSPVSRVNGTHDLTPREEAVLGLLTEGLGQAEIAEQLVLSPRTVGNHIQNIITKLGTHSRSAAIARAFRDQIVKTS